MMGDLASSTVVGDVEGTAASVSQQSAVALELADKRGRLETLVHAGVVLFVLGSATALRVGGQLDTATISTVYGAALGYATGLTARGRS